MIDGSQIARVLGEQPASCACAEPFGICEHERGIRRLVLIGLIADAVVEGRLNVLRDLYQRGDDGGFLYEEIERLLTEDEPTTEGRTMSACRHCGADTVAGGYCVRCGGRQSTAPVMTPAQITEAE